MHSAVRISSDSWWVVLTFVLLTHSLPAELCCGLQGIGTCRQTAPAPSQLAASPAVLILGRKRSGRSRWGRGDAPVSGCSGRALLHWRDLCTLPHPQRCLSRVLVPAQVASPGLFQYSLGPPQQGASSWVLTAPPSPHSFCSPSPGRGGWFLHLLISAISHLLLCGSFSSISTFELVFYIKSHPSEMSSTVCFFLTGS